MSGVEECQSQLIWKERTCLKIDFYKAYVSHNQDFEYDHTVDIKFREKNYLIAIFRLRSVAYSMFAKNSASFPIKSNFVLPKTFMEQLTQFNSTQFNL